MGNWKTRTRMVHDGIRRSQYGEVSEAIFLTQGFVYDTAEQAEARFMSAGDDEFIYARYGNPTVRMFEERIASLEGTEDAFATASGMAAVSGALTSLLRAGDQVVASRALFGSCLYILEEILPRFGVEVDLRRRHRPRPVARRGASRHPRGVLRDHRQPDARDDRHGRRRRDRPCRRRAGDRRQRLRHARSCRPRRRWGPTWWSIRPPSTSTGRGGRWAAWCWAGASSSARRSSPT